MQCRELPQFARLRFERIRLKFASVSNGKLTHRERCLSCSERYRLTGRRRTRQQPFVEQHHSFVLSRRANKTNKTEKKKAGNVMQGQ